MDSLGDKFTDSIAFARCVLRDDWTGMESIVAIHDDLLDLLIPQSWILNATIARLATELGLSIDEVWMVMIQSVETVGRAVEEEENDDED